jgi:predicted GIY-YIG superfamily endonuclease
MREQESFWVYILRCADGSYYTGRTRNLSRRVAEHDAGAVGGYTHSRRPVILVYSQEFATAYQANEAEQQIKGWSRAKKGALIAGDFDLLKHLSRCRNRTSHKHR